MTAAPSSGRSPSLVVEPGPGIARACPPAPSWYGFWAFAARFARSSRSRTKLHCNGVRLVQGIETQGGELGDLLKQAVRRSLFPLVVIAPLLVVCWQVSQGRPIGKLTLSI